MVSLTVFNKSGKEVGTYDLDPAQLAPKVSPQLLHDVVVMYQANQRLGTHKTKARGEVAGTTKKMYRQKGTGNARAGSRRSPLRRGGGHAFALRNRDYSYRLPKKAIQAATRMALVRKLEAEDIVVIDELVFTEPKSKDMAAILKVLGLAGRSTLVATATHDPNVYRSARNIDKVCVSPVAELNALSVLTPRKILVTKAALDAIKSRGSDSRGKETEKESAKPARGEKKPAAKRRTTKAKS